MITLQKRKEILEKIKYKLEEYNLTGAIQDIRILWGYALDKRMEETIQNVIDAIENFEYEDTVKILALGIE